MVPLLMAALTSTAGPIAAAAAYALGALLANSAQVCSYDICSCTCASIARRNNCCL